LKQVPQFNEEEKLVLQLAVALTRTTDVHDDLYEGLRRCFSEREQVDLNAVIAREKIFERESSYLRHRGGAFSARKSRPLPEL
jgi:alkylhydroperoxidase family enzyme